MSNQNNKNLLTPLRRKGNKYIHRNAVPKSMDIATPSPSPSPLPVKYNYNHDHPSHSNQQQPTRQNIYTHPNYIRSEPHPQHPLYEPEVGNYLAPHNIKYPLEIIFIKGGTEQARTRHSMLECTTNKKSIEAALMYILSKEKIKIPYDNFNFGYRLKYDKVRDKDKNKKDVERIESIYDLNIAEVLDQDIKTLVFRQVVPYEEQQLNASNNSLSSFTKAGNKARMENTYNDIKRAELVIQNSLESEYYDKLKKNKGLFLSAKYDLGVRNMDWDVERAKIIKDLETDNHYKAERSVPVQSTQQQSISGNISNVEVLNTLQSLNNNLSSMTTMLCTLINQRQPVPSSYTAQHGTTATVTQARFDPRNVTSIPRNVAAPPLPALPTTFETNLPTLSNGKEEAD